MGTKTLEGSTRYVDVPSVQRQLAETFIEEVVEQGDALDSVALEPIVVELKEVVVSAPPVDFTESMKTSVRRPTVTQEPILQSVVYQPTSPTKRKSVAAQPTLPTLYQSMVQPAVVQEGVTQPPTYQSMAQPAGIQGAVTQPTLYQSIVQSGVQETVT